MGQKIYTEDGRVLMVRVPHYKIPILRSMEHFVFSRRMRKSLADGEFVSVCNKGCGRGVKYGIKEFTDTRTIIAPTSFCECRRK